MREKTCIRGNSFKGPTSKRDENHVGDELTKPNDQNNLWIFVSKTLVLYATDFLQMWGARQLLKAACQF